MTRQGGSRSSCRLAQIRESPPAKLIALAKSIEADGRIRIEKINAPFLRTLKASGAELGAGLACAIEHGWMELQVPTTSRYWLRARVRSNNRAKLALPADVHWHDPPIPAGPNPTPSRATIPAGIAPAGATPAGPPPRAPAGSPPCRSAGDPEADTEAYRWRPPATAPPAASPAATVPAAAVPSSVKAALGGRRTGRQGEHRCDAESEKRLLDHDNLQFELRDLNVLRSPWFFSSSSRCTSRSAQRRGSWRVNELIRPVLFKIDFRSSAARTRVRPGALPNGSAKLIRRAPHLLAS